LKLNQGNYHNLAYACMGGDLGGTGGRSPKNWGGRRPMHSSPNISWSNVIGCVWKYELSKKMCNEGLLCSETDVFRQEKGHSVIYQI